MEIVKKKRVPCRNGSPDMPDFVPHGVPGATPCDKQIRKAVTQSIRYGKVEEKTKKHGKTD